jgi:hypothetical protein
MAKTLASQAKNGGSIPLARSARPATPADAAPIAALAVASIRAYTWFAPEGWTPPGDKAEAELAGELVRRLGASAWGFVADDSAAAPFFDERIGFEIVEYRRPLAVTGS